MTNELNLPFGLNVRLPQRTLQQMQETLEGQVENLFMPINNFFEVGENVFNGNVAEKIDTYNRQTYNLGAIMRNGIEKPTFDMKM